MGKNKILVVDGDEITRNLLRKSLNEIYEVHTTYTCEEALVLFKEEPFDIIITEVDTPDIKGVEVIRKFKELKSDITLIVMTTYGSVQLAVEAMKQGAYDYLTKPFNMDELKLVVSHALERHQLLEDVKEKEIYKELAILDSLTGIYNRRYFEEMLRREVERATRYPQNFSLFIIDIDVFKHYNDTYGHLGGDKVLKEIADLLFRKTRSTDFVARFGGDEFVIIAPHTNKEQASILAARLLDMVAHKEFVVNENTVTKLTISIGVASCSEDAQTRNDLINAADTALYEAKRFGKNRACFFGTSKQVQSQT